jgi:DNA repair exonuclease SbcCD nuclease subunit
MRIIVFSDLHSDEHDDFSYVLPNGMNSRLADCLSVIDKVMHYRDTYKCELVLFGGDMFHVPGVISTRVFQETYKRLGVLAETSKRLIIMAGNHDVASVTPSGEAVSTVYATSRLPNTKVAIGRKRSIAIDDVVIHCLPYVKDNNVLNQSIKSITRTIDKHRRRHHIMITHIGIDEATNGPNEIVLRNSFPTRSLRKTGAHAIFCGHHHHPQSLPPRVDVIGSPLQLNMLDRGDRRGIVMYDTDSKLLKRIWLGSSKFFLYELRTAKDFDELKRDQALYRGGYVRILLTAGAAPESKVRDVVDATARMYKILPVMESKSGVRSQEVTQKAVANIGNIEAVLPDYVEHIDPSNLKRKRLVRIGRRLLRNGRTLS